MKEFMMKRIWLAVLTGGMVLQLAGCAQQPEQIYPKAPQLSPEAQKIQTDPNLSFEEKEKAMAKLKQEGKASQ